MAIKCNICGTINADHVNYCSSCLQSLKVVGQNSSNDSSNINDLGYENHQVCTITNYQRDDIKKEYKEKSTLLMLFLYLIEFVLTLILIELVTTVLFGSLFNENSLPDVLLNYVVALLIPFVALSMLLRKQVPKDPNIFSNTILVLATLFYTVLMDISLYLSDVAAIYVSEYIRGCVLGLSIGCFTANMANHVIKKVKKDKHTNRIMVITNMIVTLFFISLFVVGIYTKVNGIMITGYYANW